MPSYLKFLLLFVVSAALVGLSTSRQVLLNNTNGCKESGLLVWGGSLSSQPPASFKGGCDGKIELGAITEASNGANQAVAFTVGRPPAIGSGLKWNDPGPITLTYPAAYELPVKFWVLHTPSNCSFTCTKAFLGEFLIWANGVLERERTGLQLVLHSSGISDQTNNTTPQVQRYRTFTHGTPDDCDSQTLADLAAKLYQSQAINVYVVFKVDSSTTRGYMCPDAPDRAFVASRANQGTFLHEMGHMFNLAHIDDNAALDQENVMHSASDVRAYFTEGQVFRMNFSQLSILNSTFQLRTADQRMCIGSNLPAALPCPSQEITLWREK